MKIAIIGCGEMGWQHAECLTSFPQIELFAFCDQDLQRAQQMQHHFQGEIATDDPAVIWEKPDIHVVYIATHTNSHRDLCKSAIHAKKHFMIEKPLALTAQQALEIYEYYELHAPSLIAMSAFKFRFYEMIQKARTLLSSVYMISVQIMDDPWPAGFWANQSNVGGGNVISQGVHGTDLLRYLADSEPDHVYAVGKNYHQSTKVVDNLSATFRFKNGVSGTLIVGDCAEAPLVGKFMVQMHGREGSLLLTNRLTRIKFKSATGSEVREWKGEESGFMEENRHFLSALLGNRYIPSTLWDGYMAQLMIDSALESARKKRLKEIG
jgi:predicted dehydrogenase